jgi:hypothetical protein
MNAKQERDGLPRMPFGKYRGQLLEDVPTDYLEWLLDAFPLRPFLRRAVERELTIRAGNFSVKPAAPDWLAIIRQWHREMALQFHPDRGGHVEAMRAINLGAERLRELVDSTVD